MTDDISRLAEIMGWVRGYENRSEVYWMDGGSLMATKSSGTLTAGGLRDCLLWLYDHAVFTGKEGGDFIVWCEHPERSLYVAGDTLESAVINAVLAIRDPW